MFTGIIEQTATVTEVVENASGLGLSVQLKGWSQPVDIGESISIDGCCLTVTSVNRQEDQIILSFDVVHETIRLTTISDFVEGTQVNVERAMRADSFVGGHIVQGHIDGIARVLTLTTSDEGECRLTIDTTSLDQKVLIPKGSIAINGVSLTIATVGNGWLDVALIPMTLRTTTLSDLHLNQELNIETDLLVKTTLKMVEDIKPLHE